MEEFVLPQGPTLIRPSIIKCTPDDLLLVCNSDLTIIHPDKLNRTKSISIDLKPAKRPHCVVVNDKTYNNPHCYASVCGSNNVVILIDLKDCKVKKICNVFMKELWNNSNNDFLVSVSFMDDDVFMISERGVMAQWRTDLNKCTILPKFLNQAINYNFRINVTCMAVCPHDSRYIAIGLKYGIILLVTLNSSLSYPIRKFSHGYGAIYNIVWCPAPFNVRDMKEKTTKENSSKKETSKVELSKVKKSKTNSHEKLVESLENQSVDWSLLNDSPQEASLDYLSDNSKPPRPSYAEIFDQQLREIQRRLNEESVNENGSEKSNKISEPNSKENSSDEEDHNSIECPSDDETKRSNLANIKKQETVENNETYLLLSTSSNGELKIWDVLKDSALVLNCRIRNKSYIRKDSFYSPILWLNERFILFVSGYEVRYFDIREFKDAGNFQTLHVHHKHPIYALAAPYHIVSLHDIKSGATNIRSKNIWSIDNCERLVRLPFNRDLNKLIVYSLCKNVINRFSVSQIDHHNIAICSQTNFISFWTLNESNPYKFNMTYVRLKLPFPNTVLCIVLHPKCEYVAAISLSNGSINVVNIADDLPKIKTIRDNNTEEIYSISWGPYSNSNFAEKFCIYAAINGKVLIYDPDSHSKKNFIFRNENNVTTVSWNYEFDKFAVGICDGSVSFYNKDLQYIMRNYYCKAFIYKLIWHPHCADKNTDLDSTVIVVAKEKNVYVYDPEKEPSRSVVAILKGHEHFVYDACWSPFESNLLVTASADFTAKVWDVLKQTQLASFNEHGNALYSVCWHPLYPNIIMSSGLDITLRFWNYENHPPVLDALELRKKKVKKNDNAEMVKIETINAKKPETVKVVIQEKTPESETVIDDVPKSDNNKTNNNENDNEDFEIDDALLANIPIQSEITSQKKVDNRLLILSYVQDQTSILDAGYSILEPDQPNIKKNIVTQFFSDNCDDIYDLLNMEQKRQETKKLIKNNESLHIWRSKLEKCIEQNIKNNTLTERLISLAPMVSHELWSVACGHFSKQCLKKGDIAKAVDYLLVLHKIQEAINVYLAANLYREAYILAKCHYSPKNPILKTILVKWVSFLLDTGCFEMAGLCLIKLKDYEKAAKVLSRRTHNHDVLELALHVAKKTTCKDLIDSITQQVNIMAAVKSAPVVNGASDTKGKN